MKKINLAEYIWLDGAVPVRQLRSKAKVLELGETVCVSDFPEWNFDGSSTNQSVGHASDLVLKPVNFIKDPVRGEGNYLVMCEVFNQDGTPHATNSRAALRSALENGGAEVEPWIGFEQEYTLYKAGRPLGWPSHGYPEPQGPYYCGVGSENVFGRELVEKHARACIEAGLAFYGINAEVMPGQWEFQIGYRGIDSDDPGILNMADHLWFARYLLLLIGENMGILPSFDNKPMPGDWNGAGCHTNFSTKAMREEGGIAAIQDAVQKLSSKHDDHIAVYGHGLDRRLTGLHETCNIKEFRSGVADRGSSIRIPLHVQSNGFGYLEDRRPGANSDPYLVSARLVTTICDIRGGEIDWSLDAILSAGK